MNHLDALWEAAQRDSFPLTTVPRSLDELRGYLSLALSAQAAGHVLAFATCDAASGRVLGSTRFADLQRWRFGAPYEACSRTEGVDGCEIGWTWLVPEARRTPINTEAKLLMLDHAFVAWEARRVTLKTDARNARSRAAIERLGARLDGILRAHMPATDGTARDSAFYSILREEWPPLRDRLRARLA